jgi:hypothetical protein
MALNERINMTKLETIWKEVVVAYSKVPYRYFPGGTWKKTQ